MEDLDVALGGRGVSRVARGPSRSPTDAGAVQKAPQTKMVAVWRSRCAVKGDDRRNQEDEPCMLQGWEQPKVSKWHFDDESA